MESERKSHQCIFVIETVNIKWEFDKHCAIKEYGIP